MEQNNNTRMGWPHPGVKVRDLQYLHAQ